MSIFSNTTKNDKVYICVKYNGSEIHIEHKTNGSSIHEYDAELIKGTWPKDEDLITLCDGDDPKHPCHFGGKVFKTGNTAHILVYVD